MTPILPISTTQIDHIEVLAGLAAVLPAHTAIEAVSALRTMFQMLQDYVWETAITSVEGVLALGAFNLLVSFVLAMWVACAVRRVHLGQCVAMLNATTARHLGTVRVAVFGPPTRAAGALAGLTEEPS